MQNIIQKFLKVLEKILFFVLFISVVVILFHSIFNTKENLVIVFILSGGFILFFLIYLLNFYFHIKDNNKQDLDNKSVQVFKEKFIYLYEQLFSVLDLNIILVHKKTKKILLASQKTSSLFKIRSLKDKNIDEVLNSFFLELSLEQILQMMSENKNNYKLKTDNNSSFELVFHELLIDKLLNIEGDDDDEQKNPKEFILLEIYDRSHKDKVNLSESSFISDISHELKTPLTIIKAYTETLLLNELDEKKTEEFLNIINRETDVAKLLISKLIRLTNLDYGVEQPEFENADIVMLIKEECDRIGFLALEKDINIIYHFDKEKDVILPIDIEMIKTVIKNLVLNAIIYTNNNGRIDIFVLDKDEQVEIEVGDNGVGLSLEDKARIFDRFYTVSKSRHKDYEKFGHSGTGLGLSLVKRIIDLHKGKISVESEINKGSSFKIVLNKKCYLE